MSVIDQKEYLKKYLKIGRSPGEKKKKKKADKRLLKGLKIIDDDINNSLSQEIKDDLQAADEDAPQVVAVIDERPPSLRIDEQSNNSLWQPIGQESPSVFQNVTIGSIKLNINKDLNKKHYKEAYTKNMTLNTNICKKNQNKNFTNSVEEQIPTRANYDYSPPRKSINTDLAPKKMRDYTPSIKKEEGYSSPRKSTFTNRSPDKKERLTDSPTRFTSDDYSPPRKGRENDQLTKVRKYDDYSPPSKRRENDQFTKVTKDDDYSPPRKRREIDQFTKVRKDDDYSPPRKSKNSNHSPSTMDQHLVQSVTKTKDKVYSSQRKSTNSGSQSPTKVKTEKYSPLRKEHYPTKNDYSPPRKSSKDVSPLTKNRYRNKLPPLEMIKDQSPLRKSKKSRWSEHDVNSLATEISMPETTMSGKRSGLQLAKNLTEDIIRLQKQEEEIFKTMSSEVSGANAATIVRKNQNQKEIEDPEKEKREKELKEKYSYWGKGIKQVQDEQEKMVDQLKEMNKPLARYVDDEDLERYLKEQEREGDPMLAYIRKKKKKASVEKGISEKPTYLGDFMPNRFSIQPGYRWDGVDRSNGYEKKWFQVENSRKAVQDEALQWSQEDM